MERNKSLDLLKFVSMLFVVIIHCPFPARFGFYVDAFARFSVPVFFMTTGYFIVGTEPDLKLIKSRVLKLITYYACYELLYTIYYFIASLIKGNHSGFSDDLLNNVKFIFISPVFGFQLWYIINTAWALIIVYIFEKYEKLDRLFVISFLLHVSGILISRFSPQLFNFTLKLYFTRNFLFYSLFYIMLGACIRKKGLNKIRINKYLILAFAVIMCLAEGMERRLWLSISGTDYADYYFSTILAAPAIFVFALNSNIKSKLAGKLGSYSMPVYFLHILVIDTLNLLGNRLFHYDFNSIRMSYIGNVFYIFIVFLLSCVLYQAVLSGRNMLRIKLRT